MEAYETELKELGYNIVFAGYMGWDMENFEEELKAHPDYGRRIFHLARQSDQAIAYLYQNARFLAFCSYTEGFGLPLIEGIMRGTPVIASDIPVSREVAGDYCIWFPQDDARAFCNLVKHYQENEREYLEMKARLGEFQCITWEESSERMRKVIGL